MPTRCDTTLVVTTDKKYPGKTSPVYQFQQELGGELHRMNLGTLVPEPTLHDIDWRLEHWGTAADVDPDYIEADVIVAGQYYIRFFSEETPVVPWVKEVAKLYPHLHFCLDYFNARDGFEGGLEVQGEHISFEELKPLPFSAT